MVHNPNYLLRVLVYVSLLFILTHFAAEALRPAAQLDTPVLSYRYEKTFGETSVPFFADTEHIFAPEGVTVDRDGNLWVAETAGGRVMKYAGSGSFLLSITDPNLINNPSGIAVDGDGNLWIANRGSGLASKYDADGNYLMRLGEAQDNDSDNYRFSGLVGVAMDSRGFLYLSDEFNHHVQVFDGSGVYSTTIGITGESGSDNGHFRNPYRITIDSADNLYVADTLNHRVQVFDADHSYVTTLGITGECGDASDKQRLCEPRGVAVDSAGNLFVTDTLNHRVQIFDLDTLGYQATLGARGAGDYEFNWPGDVAVDSSGNLYVADTLNHRVQKFDSSLTYVQTFGTTGVAYLTDGYHYNQPFRIAVDAAGNIGFVEAVGHRFIKLNPNGDLQLAIGEPGIIGEDNDHFNGLSGVAFDSSGNIYTSECANRVQIFDSLGAYQDTLGVGWGSGDYEFNCPGGLFVDRPGSIYVADDFNHRVQIFDSNLNYRATLGITGEPGSDNHHFNDVQDIAVDDNGDIYVVDTGNHRVQIFNNRLVWQMTLGTTGECGEDFKHFCAPSGVAVDPEGVVYVADTGNDRVQVFDPHGVYLTTIGGTSGSTMGQLNNPYGVEVDRQGNVYIADTYNHRIQKFAPGVPGWQQTNLNGFEDPQNRGVFTLAPFNGRLYAGTYNTSGGAQLWRMTDRGIWAAVMMDGFGDTGNIAINHLMEYDEYLYAVTVGDSSHGGEAWRSLDGSNWSRVVNRGFGDPTNGEIVRLAAFSGQLYASTWSDTAAHGAELWHSSTGNIGTWSRAAEDGFDGDHNNTAITSLEVFSGYLYAGTWNEASGGEVWRSSNGATWLRVNQDGFGTADNRGVSALAAFKGYLYAATRNTPGIAGDQVWRCRVCDGSDWTKIVNNGFGDPENCDSAALEVVNNDLYLVMGNELTGMQVWRTDDGRSWQQLGFDGFGDSNNRKPYWDSSMSAFDGQLYIGTSNWAHGGEVWALDSRRLFLPLTSNQ